MTNPYAPPKAEVSDLAQDSSPAVDVLRRVARYQRLLIIGIVIIFVSPFVPVVGQWLYFGNIVFQLWCVYQLAQVLTVQERGFSTSGGVKWMVAMFIPLVNLIALLMLNRKATKYLQAAGCRVGLFGASV
jgi:uncharacterized protein involved in cysteine biosynthesis